jgi:hypothetical protein
MQNSIDKSKVSRDNILNNQLAINEMQGQIDVPGVVIDSQYYITTRQVADYFDVTTRTIEQVINNHREELQESGYRILSSRELNALRAAGVTEKNFGNLDFVPRLAVFNFKAFLNIGILLTGSEKAKILRNLVFNTAIEVVNRKAGGNTKFINQRDENYIIATYYNEGYRQEFVDALKEYVEAGNTKYPKYTDKIYRCIFKENAKEYKSILDLSKKDRVRETMYAEVITAISGFETSIAANIKNKSVSLGRLLNRNEVDKIFQKVSSDPMAKPYVEMARTKMASLDQGLNIMKLSREKQKGYASILKHAIPILSWKSVII